MTIAQFNDDKKGYFLASEEGTEAGRLIYTWAGESKFIIEHTEVNPAFKGKNIGKQLVMAAVGFAREKHLKILPLCPFAQSVFNRNKEIQDVLF